MIKTKAQQEIEQKFGPLEDYIPKWWDAELTQGREPNTDILAVHLGVHPNTLRDWYAAYGLQLVYSLRKKVQR